VAFCPKELGMKDASYLIMKSENAVFGIYRTQEEAEKAIEILESSGVDPAHVTLILPRERGQDFGYLVRTEIVLGAIVGAGAGTLIGALVGGLAGESMFFDSTTSGLFFGAIFGFFFGAVSGALVGIGTPQALKQRYVDSLRDGSVLLSIHDDGLVRSRTLRELLEETGGSEISEENEMDTWQTLTAAAGSFVKFRRNSRPFFRWLRT
jgi:hypothetical protein